MRWSRSRLLAALLALTAASLLWTALRGDGLLRRIQKLDTEVKAFEAENRAVEETNRRLLERATALKQHGPYLEGVIRRDLGMLHEGEIVVLPPPAAPTPAPTPAQ